MNTLGADINEAHAAAWNQMMASSEAVRESWQAYVDQWPGVQGSAR
jgi:hypothetical protein